MSYKLLVLDIIWNRNKRKEGSYRKDKTGHYSFAGERDSGCYCFRQTFSRCAEGGKNTGVGSLWKLYYAF